MYFLTVSDCNLQFNVICDGICRPNVIKCNFITDCENSIDEKDCEYPNGGKLTKKTESRICLVEFTSLGYLKTQIKETMIEDCQDNTCKIGEFLCKSTKLCILVDQVCDGINHCWYNDDEINCSLLFFLKNN